MRPALAAAAALLSGRLDERWLFRAGAAYDQSPVEREFRTARLPDSDGS